MKFNVNAQTRQFLSRYVATSSRHSGHSWTRSPGFAINIFAKPEKTAYYPELIKVEITTACNMACAFCGAAQSIPNWKSRPGEHISLTALEKIVDHVPMLRWIDLQGVGEPLVHPKFREILLFLAGRNISVQFTTNGLLLNKRLRETILQCPVHRITVSLSAATPENYSKLHASRLFERVLKNVEQLVESRFHPLPKIRLLAVAMSQNLCELQSLAQLAKTLGADEFALSAYKPIRAKDPFEPDLAELRQVVTQVKDYAKRIGLSLQVEIPIVSSQHSSEAQSWKKCLWPWTSIAVNVKGEIVPCCYLMGDKQFSFGNLLQNDIYEIFDGSQYRSFRSALNKGHVETMLCQSCYDHVM